MYLWKVISRLAASIFLRLWKHPSRSDLGYLLGTLEKSRNLKSIFGRTRTHPGLPKPGIHFDQHGKMVASCPFPGVCESNNCFYISQPKFHTLEDYRKRLANLRAGPCGETIDLECFKNETEHLLAHLYGTFKNSRINLCTYLPLVMPCIDFPDLCSFVDVCMEYVNLNYRRTFSDREFNNRRRGDLSRLVGVVHGCKQEALIERMKKESFVVLYFPNALQGYSIEAAREQIRLLPEGFALSGIETIIAMMMYPDVLARDLMTPGLDLGAFYWKTENYSLSFGTDGEQLGFVATKDLRGSLGISSVGISYQTESLGRAR